MDANTTDVPIGIKYTTKEPGETKENEVNDYKYATAPEKIDFTPGSTNNQ